MCMADITFLLDTDVLLEGPEDQAGEPGFEAANSEVITDSKAGGHRTKAMSQEN